MSFLQKAMLLDMKRVMISARWGSENDKRDYFEINLKCSCRYIVQSAKIYLLLSKCEIIFGTL